MISTLTNPEKLREVRRIYTIAGPRHHLFGSRSKFEKAPYRDILKERHNTIAFIEAIYINKTSMFVNFCFSNEKYINFSTVNIFFNSFANDMKSFGIKIVYISVHLSDVSMQNILKNMLAFKLITDRGTLLRNKLPIDGVHLSFFKPII